MRLDDGCRSVTFVLIALLTAPQLVGAIGLALTPLDASADSDGEDHRLSRAGWHRGQARIATRPGTVR
jgi:hypothetical protein